MKKTILGLLLMSGGLFSMEKGNWGKPQPRKLSFEELRTNSANIMRRFIYLMRNINTFREDTKLLLLLQQIQTNFNDHKALEDARLALHVYEKEELFRIYVSALELLLFKIEYGLLKIDERSEAFRHASSIARSSDIETIRMALFRLVDQLSLDSSLDRSKNPSPIAPIGASRPASPVQLKKSKSIIPADVGERIFDRLVKIGAIQPEEQYILNFTTDWKEDLAKLASDLNVSLPDNPFDLDADMMNGIVLRTRAHGLRFCTILEKCLRKNENHLDGPTYNAYSVVLAKYKSKWSA